MREQFGSGRALVPGLLCLLAGVLQAGSFDVKAFGAKGDGQTPDRAAINKAIEAASAAGGGTVIFPAGTYVTGSIRLASEVELHFDNGAALQATGDRKEYDAAEENAFNKYQDFGHSHWHNSLIWGENLHGVSITGHGLITGQELTRGLGRGDGGGDKAIALKQCRNVTLRDFSILQGGHFGLLLTGVDNLTIDNVAIDTNRDGIDVDGCRNVRIANSSVNSPNDDAIVLKTTYALGSARATENVTITNCLVSGYEIGSLLDGTYKRTVTRAPDRDGPTGRVKIGTESDGDFKNITISNVVFDCSRGLALETVDGAHIEDVTVSNITMRHITTAPFFIRIGSRMRAPEGAPVGSVKRVNISNVVVSDAESRYASIIAGLPGHDVEDVKLSNIQIEYRGGLTLAEATQQPADLVNTFFFKVAAGAQSREPYDVPEAEKGYPEPSMFGVLPASGFFLRHVNGIELRNVQIRFAKPDSRPAFVLEDAKNTSFSGVSVEKASGTATVVLKNVVNFGIRDCFPLPDERLASAGDRQM